VVNDVSPLYVESIGAVAAVLTTLCWLPQTLRAIVHRDTASLSLVTFSAFSLGILMWLIYGLYIGSWPVIGANAVSLGLNLAIVVQKLRHG
jgi:MtN3 and saliva related transmembrane protein